MAAKLQLTFAHIKRKHPNLKRKFNTDAFSESDVIQRFAVDLKIRFYTAFVEMPEDVEES